MLTSSNQRGRLKPLTLAIHLIVASAAGVLSASIAQAQTSVQTYDIPAGPLSSALNRFAQQAGVAIIFQSHNLDGLTTPGLHGVYNEQSGFDTLLRGSGYTVVKSANGYMLDAMPSGDALELGATQVSANQLGTITEGSGSYTPGSIATATRMVLTPRETPQSISVVTRQAMDDFGLTSIDDVMRHTPGITVSAYDSDRSNYYARGFSISNFQYDGIPSATTNVGYSSGNTLSDTAIYDRIEVIKGSTGLLTGAGSLGAVINLVRKKPTSEFKGHATLGAGSWDDYRSEVDVSGPLTETGNVRGRAVAAYQDKNSYQDHYSRKTSVFYGILEFDLTPDTLLTVGGDYQDNKPMGSSWSGSYPLINAKGDLNSVKRSFNNGTDWSNWKQYTRTVFATLEHDLVKAG